LKTSERKWLARWIWPSDTAHCANAHVIFRRDFELASPADELWLLIAAESFAQVWINGEAVGRTGAISYPHHHYYESWPVGRWLKPGQNRIAVLVRYIGMPSGFSCPKDPGLMVELIDGKGRVLLATDPEWFALPLQAWQGQLRRSEWFNLDLVEILDQRLLPADWPMVKIGDQGVAIKATPVPGVRLKVMEGRSFPKPEFAGYTRLKLIAAGFGCDWHERHEQPALAVSHEEIVRAVSLEEGEEIRLPVPNAGEVFTLLYALERYDKGYPLFWVEAQQGTVVDLSWHERLTDGRYDVRQSKVYSTNRYILREGWNQIEPEDWCCGRYLQLTFRCYRRPLTLKQLQWRSERYPLKRRIAFSSSDGKLERIVEIGLRSAELCFHDNIMDCPWRERRQWLGDLQRIALVNHYAFGERALVRAALRQAVGLQEPSGRMWVCLPLFEEYPTQSMEWLRAVVEYERYTGDISLRHELMPNIRLLHEWFLQQRDENGLFCLTKPPAMNWMDNPMTARLRGYEPPFAVENLRYLLFLDDIGWCFSRNGDEKQAAEVACLRTDLAARVAARFFMSECSLLKDSLDECLEPTFSELAQALAIVARIPGIDAETVWNRWSALADANDLRIIRCGPFGKYWTYEALGMLGRRQDIMHDLLRWWGPMADAEGDTAWEHFEDRGSRCHGWAGIPIVALMRHLFEMDPRIPALRVITGMEGIDYLSCEVKP